VKLEDRFALGFFSGILAVIPQLLFNFISVQLNFAKWYNFQISGSIYLHPGNTGTFPGMLLGALVWLIPAAMMGVLISYLIESTGEDFYWLKGIGVSLTIMFLIIYGFLFTLGGATIIPFDFATNFSMLIDNALYGLAAGYLVVYFRRKLRRQ
jgi:hypothetical protein